MAIDCYIEIPDCPGESAASDYADCIEADTISFGVSSRGGQSTELMELTFTHPIDKASPKLMESCVTDADLDAVTISMVEEGTAYMTIVLAAGSHASGADAATCRVTSVTTTGVSGAGDRPREQVSIRYGKLTVTYTSDNIEFEYDSSLT